MKNKTLQGRGCSVEVSLKKGGFAWCENETEFTFFYGVETNWKGEYDTFECDTLPVNTNLQTAFDWAEWESCPFTKLTKKEFLNQPLPLQVEALMNYYGFENIFRSQMSYEKIINQTE